MTEFDCIVIGGGPAGLAAAIYLSRFHLSTAVFDDGRSRAALIPLARNLAGYVVGIGGRDLLRRMRTQAEGFGARMPPVTVDALARRGPGYEVSDRRVALLGSGAHGLAEAQFMRSYSRDVTLVAADGPHRFDAAQRDALMDWKIVALDGPVEAIVAGADGIALQAVGATHRFDTLYAALGTTIRSELARGAGARTALDGAVLVDRHQMTSVPGLYAAGDVVKGLDQIAPAMGQAAIAATAMRNAICEARPLRR